MPYAKIGSPVSIYVHSDGMKSRSLSCVTYEGTRSVTYFDGGSPGPAEYDISVVPGSYDPSEAFSEYALDRLTYQIRSYLHMSDPCRSRASVDLMASESDGRITFSLM